MAKEKKETEGKEGEAGKSGETLEELQEKIEKQAQELVKQAGEQPAQTVEPAADQPPAQAAPRTISLDEAGAKNSYSNFCYTAGTREGVLFGFGFHDWQPGNPIKVDTKVEMSYFNAKRLLATLNQVIKRHETAFGEIEIDINKRIKVKPTGGGTGGVA